MKPPAPQSEARRVKREVTSAWHGLAMNPALPASERLEIALSALNMYAEILDEIDEVTE